MKTTYDPSLKAQVTTDQDNKVRHIRHNQEYWESEENVPRASAEGYLNEVAGTYQIPQEQLQNLHKKVSFYDPREQGVEYQLDEEKHLFDSTTIGYYQTFLNTPVWRKGLTVKIKQNPNRVIASTNNSEDDLKGTLPDKKSIDKYKDLFRQVALRQTVLDPALGEVEQEADDEAAEFVRNIIGVTTPKAASKSARGKAERRGDETQVLSAKFFVYKYDPRKRYAGRPAPRESRPVAELSAEVEEIPVPKLPSVSDKIKAGRAYLFT